jgi:hypothetical protein
MVIRLTSSHCATLCTVLGIIMAKRQLLTTDGSKMIATVSWFKITYVFYIRANLPCSNINVDACLGMCSAG